MRHRLLLIALLLGSALNVAAGKKHSYLFAWCGDDDKKASDFLAVLDADPASPEYGQVVATAPTGVAGSRPHHTEVEMPAGGLLMANKFSSRAGTRSGAKEAPALSARLKPCPSTLSPVPFHMAPSCFGRNGKVKIPTLTRKERSVRLGHPQSRKCRGPWLGGVCKADDSAASG